MSVYQPGVCNIGAAEIALRSRVGHLGVLASLGLAALLFRTRAPRAARLTLVVPAGTAAAGYLQARSRFCVAYGLLGVHNEGPVGRVDVVADPEAQALDAATARRIGLQSAGFGLAVAMASMALPR